MFVKKKFTRKKVCYFTKNHIKNIDYKDVETLKKFISPNGKSHLELQLEPAHVINVCWQRLLKTLVSWDYFRSLTTTNHIVRLDFSTSFTGVF